METIVIDITYILQKLSIEYLKRPLKHKEATKPCGNGTYVFNSKTNQLCRWGISLSHEIPYSYNDNWNSSGNWHLVIGSSIPLPVWWCMPDNENLSFGDIGCALPQLKINNIMKPNPLDQKVFSFKDFQELYLKKSTDPSFHALLDFKNEAIIRGENSISLESKLEEIKKCAEAYELARDLEAEELTHQEFLDRQYKQYLEYNQYEIADKLVELISKLWVQN